MSDADPARDPARTDHDLAHLAALIVAAQAEAARLGPAAGTAAALLAQALTAARSNQAGGRADEGIRPENLTTDNDK